MNTKNKTKKNGEACRKKPKAQSKIGISRDRLPTPEVVNPAAVDRQIVSFYDDTEEKFLQRELLRSKLRRHQLGVNGYIPDDNVIVPDSSDIEELTRLHYLRLTDKLKNGTEVEKMEIKILKKDYNSTSLVDIATRLAEASLNERLKNEQKSWFSLGPAESRVTKDKVPGSQTSRRGSRSGLGGGDSGAGFGGL